VRRKEITVPKRNRSLKAAVAPAVLVVPPSKPRDRIATDPLLRKSGAHGDPRRKRVRAEAMDFADAVNALRRTYDRRREGGEG
jgi:hypothetical protein